jgi:hypothetical protein
MNCVNVRSLLAGLVVLGMRTKSGSQPLHHNRADALLDPQQDFPGGSCLTVHLPWLLGGRRKLSFVLIREIGRRSGGFGRRRRARKCDGWS